MLNVIFRRVLSLIPILLLVSFGVFLLISLVPGDAAYTLAGGERASQERIEEVRQELGLDDPVPVQYARWLSSALRLDFGSSLYSAQPVSSEIVSRLPVTLGLAFAALIVGIAVGVPLAVVSAVRAGRPSDSIARFLTSAGIAVPNFVVAILLVLVVAVQWGWLPTSGFVRFTESPLDWLRHMGLPALTLGLGLAAILARQLRASLVDTFDRNFVRTAWAKGLRGRTVVFKHAMKNAAQPAVTVLAVQTGYLLGGTVIIEQIFAIPGLGAYMLRAIERFDLPVIQAVTLVFVLTQVTINLLVDLLYGVLNPKVRTG
jgi:peptide/nickel transport system permease protein